MDVKNAKVLDNGRRILVKVNGKLASPSAKRFTGATCKLTPQHVIPDEPSGRRSKRLRSGGCKNSCNCNYKKSMVKNYFNFKRSGLPQRVLYCENGDWSDFPDEIVNILKKHFEAKKVHSEVVYKNRSSLFDFSHMVHIDIETGLQQPIGWIDESGWPFLPNLYSDFDDMHNCLSFEGEDQVHLSLDHNGTHEIKLQLEIAITGDDKSPSEECYESSVSGSKRRKIDSKPAENVYDLKQSYSGNEQINTDLAEGFGENVPSPFSVPENLAFESKYGKLDKLLLGGSDYSAIEKMFLAAFTPLVKVKEIVGIYQGSPSSTLVLARLQFFQKLVEIMSACRGDANVRYAWFACSEESVARIMFHRFAHTERPKFKPAYGSGIHLIPANCSDVSANHFDVDENGVQIQHMLLCRVILGNTELIPLGSEQFEPSNENYDSGVDDLENPKHYIVWDMNMNSHIYPEYVVSFRMSPNFEEPFIARESKTDMSGVTHSTLPCSQMQRDCASVDLISANVKQLQGNVESRILCAPKIPSSPWMSFPMLLAAISTEVPRNNMELIKQYYADFKKKTLNRVDFIKKLRSVVGDDLLRSTIKGLQNETCSTVECGSLNN